MFYHLFRSSIKDRVLGCLYRVSLTFKDIKGIVKLFSHVLRLSDDNFLSGRTIQLGGHLVIPYSAEMSAPTKIVKDQTFILQLVDGRSYPVYSSYAPLSKPKVTFLKSNIG